MRVIGHRGAPGIALENTLASLASALEVCDGIECDLRTTRDGGIVLVHDADLRRIAGVPADVASLALSQIRRVRLLDGQVVPTLDELLELARTLARRMGSRLLLDLEIKDARVAAQLGAVLARHETTGLELLVTCFDERVMRHLPGEGFARGLLDRGRRARPVTTAVASRCSWLAVRHGSRGALRRARSQGLGTLVWTVDDPASALAYAELGIDVLCTNAPHLIAKVVARG